MLNIGEFARLGQVSPRMLRHYDAVGLLKPDGVDARSGYRSYDVAQLGRLHRIVALRDLGLSLDQIHPVLDDDLSTEQLRGMLRLRQAQIERDVAEDQARLGRVAAHLQALEWSDSMSSLDVAIKTTEPVRVAAAHATASGFGHENIGPVFERLVPEVLTQLDDAHLRPGIMIAWYDEPDDDGAIVVHVGFDIDGHSLPDTSAVTIVELPRITVASVVHQGTMDNIGSTYEALVRWIDESGNQIAGRSRELYHAWNNEHPEQSVTELQMPVAP